MNIKIIGLLILEAVYSCASKPVVAITSPLPSKSEVVRTAPTESKVIIATVELEVGKTAYENNCAKCHNLYDPREFPKQDWAPILVRMQSKAHLSDADMAPITNYIYAQF